MAQAKHRPSLNLYLLALMVATMLLAGLAGFRLSQRVDMQAMQVEANHRLDLFTAAIAWCDQNRLEQVLINLIGNAIDAMSDQVRRVLTLSVRHEGEERILISIADTGPGFSDQALAHLFEPFFTTKPVGEGLGLAISRDIVGDFGGSLHASNKSQGQGAMFTIDLPAAKEKH